MFSLMYTPGKQCVKNIVIHLQDHVAMQTNHEFM